MQSSAAPLGAQMLAELITVGARMPPACFFKEADVFCFRLKVATQGRSDARIIATVAAASPPPSSTARWASCSVLRPARSTMEMCTNTSLTVLAGHKPESLGGIEPLDDPSDFDSACRISPRSAR